MIMITQFNCLFLFILLSTNCTHFFLFTVNLDILEFFPGPQAFCKKAVERVNSEKNILNR